jgi:hypothetical protein
MTLNMPAQFKFLLLLPFGLLAAKGLVLTALVFGPTNSFLGQIKAPSAGGAVPAMAVMEMAQRAGPAHSGKGPF